MTKRNCHIWSESRRTASDEAAERQEVSLLSPRRAFVVQLRTPTATAPEHCAGRVEHMVSGRAVRFHSPEELVAFIKQILNDVRE